MRIMSGTFRGRIIRWPKGIRPTQDKVRKALFDILSDIQGLSFLDLYAGSGAVGIEALSYGAGRVAFVEKDKQCVRIIKHNLSAIMPRLLDGQYCYVIAQDAFRAIERIKKQNERFDVIFLDPPYYPEPAPRLNSALRTRTHSTLKAIADESLSKKTLKSLNRYDIVARNGLIVCQHFKKDSPPEAIDALRLIKQGKYGDTILSFYKKITDST